MRPIIYLYEDQVNKVFQENPDGTFRAIGFGWPEEHVYHVFTQVPSVAPSGYPTPTVISFVSDADFQNAQMTARLTLESQFPNRTNEGIVIYFNRHENQLRKVAFGINGAEVNECKVLYVPGRSHLYSRSEGLLEVDLLEKKSVAIIGLGSFGSSIAVELAKAGIGNFVLLDYDRLELSNIARHACGINDLGRFKTRAVKDLITSKNPFAKIDTYEIDVNENIPLFQNAISACDLVICVTDENRSRFNVNKAAMTLMKKVIFSRAITRAEGGDVYRFDPATDSPCLSCLVGEGFLKFQSEVSTLQQARRDTPDYVETGDLDAVVQVGLSSDIQPICNMVVKLALVELSKGDSRSGLQSLEEDFNANYYIWANRRERYYQNWLPMGFTANRPSILRWYGVRVQKRNMCGNSCLDINPSLMNDF